MAILDTHWELGSEFHWMGIPQGPFISWPEPHALFASGREAFLSAWRMLHKSSSNVLFVPDYFCEEVVLWWEQRGVATQRYIDGPHREGPDWETLTVSPGDVVLAVNYFGVRDAAVWASWRQANDKVFLVEDHSHDPLSPWALNSTADYSFASLRKTFPSPDGAILWSSRRLPLPSTSVSADCHGSALKLAAMVLKEEYLRSGNEQVKKTFREFQLAGEESMSASRVATVSPWSRFLLSFGYPQSWRNQRETNVRTFYTRLKADSSVQRLFSSWPPHHCPYNAVLLFSSSAKREASRLHLIAEKIYPSLHWELGPAASPEALDVSSRILTIPADQRYGENDMMRVAATLPGGSLHG